MILISSIMKKSKIVETLRTSVWASWHCAPKRLSESGSRTHALDYRVLRHDSCSRRVLLIGIRTEGDTAMAKISHQKPIFDSTNLGK